ncbi:MAG: polysaccharide pyruvyl transferase family protein [Thermoplasmatales archaeon]|nr:MAG: polysaccharide pyruvyl transferase family protein [Thermoplasmatales archaeon]
MLDDNKRQFFIHGYLGFKNTGDEAMLYALLHKINEYFPKDIFVISSKSKSIAIPKNMQNRVKIIKIDMKTRLIELHRSSFFIITGGTSIFDYTKSRFLNILGLLLYFRLLLLAKICCKKLLFLSIGVSPISSRFGNYIAKKMYETADYITVRDKQSLKLLKDMHVKTKVKLSFDLSAFLPIPSSKKIDKKNENVLGVSILPYYLAYRNNRKKDMIFLDNIANALQIWLKKNKNNKVHLFTFQGKHGKSILNDEDITKELYKKLNYSNSVKLFPYQPNPIKIISEMEKCNAILGMRYHASLFACFIKKPLIMINYQTKCISLAEDFNLQDNAIISPEQILNGKLDGYIEKLLKNPKDFIARSSLESLQKRNFLFDDEMLKAIS